MFMELPENLAELCHSNGWLYAIVWGQDRCDHRLLVVEDSYCEQQVKEVVEKMLNLCQKVGEGIIGGTATSGITRWLYHDNCTTTGFCSAADGINSEFFKTNVLIPLASSGVAQFGSTKKVPESPEFVNQVKTFFERKELRRNFFNIQQSTFPSNNSSDCYSYCDDSNSHSMTRDWMLKSVPSRGLTQFNIDAKRYNQYSKSHNSSISPQVLAIPVNSNSIGFFDQIQTPLVSKESALRLTNIKNLASNDVQVQLQLPDTRLLSHSNWIESSFPAYFNADNCAKNSDLSVISKEFSSSAGMHGFPGLLPAKSLFSTHHQNLINRFSGESPSTSVQYGFEDLIFNADKFHLNQRESPNANGFGYMSSFVSKIPNTSVVSSHDTVLENVLFLDSQHNQTHNQIVSDRKPDLVSDETIVKETFSGNISASSCIVECDASANNMATQLSNLDAGHSLDAINSQASGKDTKNASLLEPAQLVTDNDLFDIMELDFDPSNFLKDYLDDMTIPSGCPSSSITASECFPEMEKDSFTVKDKDLFSGFGIEQILNNIDKKNANKTTSYGSVTENVHPTASHFSDHQLSKAPPVFTNQFPSICIPSVYETSNVSLPKCIQDVFEGSKKEASPKSSATNSQSIDDRCSMNTRSSVLNQPKKTVDVAKIKKRARPGESTRPRPKDRQQIQDRVKELREIVPNGTKCSIDSLLNRTIKYMLFMQSVTKYADKLKQADHEPKIILEESGVLLKDDSGENRSGATWAYEVAGRTMVCPIIVEDMTPTGQMLVEMLCEDRGFFLEIADIIRGFGLTILKGVMENSEHKIWARFLVEANKDVTRMDIFLSLVQLLQQTNSKRSNVVDTEVFQKETPLLTSCQQSAMTIPVVLGESLH